MYTDGNDCELTEDTPTDAEVVGGESRAAAVPSSRREVAETDPSSAAGQHSDVSREHSSSSSSKERSSSGSGAGIPVIKRTSELRIMCSPDLETRVYVQEPRQCRYRVELYVPLLCLTEGFRVEGHSIGQEEPIIISVAA